MSRQYRRSPVHSRSVPFRHCTYVDDALRALRRSSSSPLPASSSPYAVYDLLTSPDCLPDLLQGGLIEQGVREAFILTTFKLQPRTGTSVFSLYNPRDSSKYFEFTVMGKLNRGRTHMKEARAPFKIFSSPCLFSQKLLLISGDFRGTYGENRLRLGKMFPVSQPNNQTCFWLNLHRCHQRVSSSQVVLIRRGSENTFEQLASVHLKSSPHRRRTQSVTD